MPIALRIFVAMCAISRKVSLLFENFHVASESCDVRGTRTVCRLSLPSRLKRCAIAPLCEWFGRCGMIRRLTGRVSRHELVSRLGLDLRGNWTSSGLVGQAPLAPVQCVDYWPS